MPRIRTILAVTAGTALIFGACKKEQKQSDYPQNAQGYPPYYPPPEGTWDAATPASADAAPTPTPTATSSTPTPPPASTVQAAAGFPCQTDNDIVCAFGRCLGNRCGGCRDNNECKAGSACVST